MYTFKNQNHESSSCFRTTTSCKNSKEQDVLVGCVSLRVHLQVSWLMVVVVGCLLHLLVLRAVREGTQTTKSMMGNPFPFYEILTRETSQLHYSLVTKR